MKITDECWMQISDAGELDLRQAKFYLKGEKYYVSAADPITC
jgi:hypothetical protein